MGPTKKRVVVVGTGFAGYHCLRTLERRLPNAELVAVNPADFMLYVPLLPEVAGGTLDPRRVAVALRTKLRRTTTVLGSVTGIDLEHKTVTVDEERRLDWDRLVIASGSVTRLLSIPGVAEHAKGFTSIAESVYLRDHVLRQLELAEQSDDPTEREQRTTFVVVGAGYTGTELAAQGVELTRKAKLDARWVLVDMADRVLPNLGERLSGPAHRILERRGVEVRLGTGVAEVTDTRVQLSDGTEIPTRTVAWCVGVRPDPLVEPLGLPTTKGRLDVDEYLRVPSHPDVFAAGDVAAVPDLTRPGEITPMTAQHAQRQGRAAAINVAASLGTGRQKAYRHRDLGFVVDLAGAQAVADPLHVPLRGWPAKVVTRAYHLMAMPANRLRVALDWIADLLTRRQVVHLGLVPDSGVSLAEADGAGPHKIESAGLPAAGPGSPRPAESGGSDVPMPTIEGKRVAFLATDGVEQVELDRPWQAVSDAGGRPELVSLTAGEIQAFNHLDKADRKKVDTAIDKADPGSYDALVLPGGVANGDFVRADERAVRFVKEFVTTGKPVAVICHGGWVLAEADVVRGRTMTSWPSLRTDLRNAGATWVDKEVVTDQGLVSSRKPDDLDAFCAKAVEEIAEGVHA